MSSVQGAGAHVWACSPMEVEIQCRRHSRNSPGVPPLPGLPQPCDVALKEPVPPRPSPVPPAAPTDLACAGAHRATPPTKRDFSMSALWNTGTEHPMTFSHCTLWSHASEDRPHGHSRKPNVNVEQQRQQVCAAGHKDQQARHSKPGSASSGMQRGSSTVSSSGPRQVSRPGGNQAGYCLLSAGPVAMHLFNACCRCPFFLDQTRDLLSFSKHQLH
ncbi:uncharacterized protein LOC128315074 [Acinonyx jubatus]|uniref:Uncharacterized protein LOC128315074 n=1 Tax=Acinonyx jubatus TaxID=32536 RepID=A0ABM3PXI6_ACIJB|nr:uncharacterized protein LOC128315074 [Acinonyx jubatus]